MKLFANATLIVGLIFATGCPSGDQASGGPGDYEIVEPEITEKPIMTIDGGEDDQEKADPNAPPPPPGTAAAAPAEMTGPLKGYDKAEDGQTLAIKEALTMAVEAYQRNQPGSATEPGQPGWPDLTNLNQLVQVGIIRAVPAPPAGKKWELDPKTGEVKAVDAQ